MFIALHDPSVKQKIKPYLIPDGGPDMLEKFKDFNRIFNPERIAVIGVSKEGFGFGRGILISLKSIGFEGEIYPVNPSGGEVLDMKLYRSVDEIPVNIDFAIIAVPAKAVPEALEACLKKGAAGAEILSAGFGEAGTPEGDALDKQIREISAKGLRLIGPNCFGIYCPKSGLTMLPGPDLSRETGPVALLAQSGGISIDFAYLGKWRGVKFSKMLSFGNGCDLRETEMLEYLRHDPETQVICMYMEGVEEGRKFLDELTLTAMEKPVIIMKGGLSKSGGRAVSSHTASMGGSRKIWEAALRQCNAIQVENLQEMCDAALAFSLLPPQTYKGMTIIGGGGAIGINAADTAEKLGLEISPLRKDLQDKIRPLLPQPGSSPVNPIDVANPFVPPDALGKAMAIASEDENIQIHVMVQLLASYNAVANSVGAKNVRDLVPVQPLADCSAKAVKDGGKPMVMVLPNQKQEPEMIEIEKAIREAREKLLAAGIPVFERLKDALKAIVAVSVYYERKTAILSFQEKAAS